MSQRVMLTIHDDVRTALTVLGCTSSSLAIGPALVAYARAIEYATASVSQALDRADWNYLADCLNGCWHVQALSGLSARSALRAEAEDAHRLNRLGEKWYGTVPLGDEKNAELVPASQQEIAQAVDDLLTSIHAMTEIEAQAVLLAVRHFWNRPEIDHTVDEWWTVQHRRS